MSDRVGKHGEIISSEIRDKVSTRYHTITKAINREFWEIDNDISNSLYVGSYGRGTAVDSSDVDMLVILPKEVYEQHNALKGNGQSRLLQTVKNAIQTTYPNSEIHADGQVVVVDFSDGIKFEIVPAFENKAIYGYSESKFIYPDTNSGGNWKSTDPKLEQHSINNKNRKSNGLLKDTCKHIRKIHNEKFSSYHLSGILIDSFVCNAIGEWRWIEHGQSTRAPGDYERALLDYYNSHKHSTLLSPGSGSIVNTDDYQCLEKILKYMVGE